MTHSQAFNAFGTKPRNIQWSWSARNEDTKTVVVTLWQDEFKPGGGGRLTYEVAARSDNRAGFRELMDNLEWAQKNCEGRFKVIIARPRNKHAEPRQIAECFPGPMTMHITHLDIKTGAWAAEVEQDTKS